MFNNQKEEGKILNIAVQSSMVIFTIKWFCFNLHALLVFCSYYMHLMSST